MPGEHMRSLYTMLLRIEFTGKTGLPACRWALTSPFHPYRENAAVYLCCTCPEVAFGGCYPLSCPVEPGLSSYAAFWHAHAAVRLTLETNYNFVLPI